MKIPALAKLVAECWNRAEQALQDQIKQELPDINEETITVLLSGKLNAEFNKASENGAVRVAFLHDLRVFLSDIPNPDLYEISRGIIATVHFHPREVEKKTGGDFGIVFTRPDVRRTAYSRSKLTIAGENRRGLLCQAKVFRRNATWGKLSERQRKVIRERLSYFALVLYRFADQSGDRRELAPIQWQIATNATVDGIDGWLKSDVFPTLEGSQQIINALAKSEIGTDDGNMIDEYIAPQMRPALEIIIRWQDGDAPGREVQVIKSTAQAQLRQVQNG